MSPVVGESIGMAGFVTKRAVNSLVVERGPKVVSHE